MSELLELIFQSALETVDILKGAEIMTSIPNFWRGFQDVWKSRAAGTKLLNCIRQYCICWQHTDETPLDALMRFLVNHSSHMHIVVWQANKQRRLDSEQDLGSEWSTEQKLVAVDSQHGGDPQKLFANEFADRVRHFLRLNKLNTSATTGAELLHIVDVWKAGSNATENPSEVVDDFQRLLNDLRREDWYRDQMQVCKEEPKSIVKGQLYKTDQLHPAVRHAIGRITGDETHMEMYSHQARALDFLLEGNDVCVSTSTASGKSLIFMAQAVNTLVKSAEDKRGSVLTMYPTKALAQDQVTKWQKFIDTIAKFDETIPKIIVRVIDGDTSYTDRKAFAQDADIVLTNFDFCHKSILPTLSVYSRLIRNINMLIVDEAHMYRGVFGAHSALSLRRILLMHHILAPPENEHVQIITCSATLGNPAEHFQLLTGRGICKSVSEDGAPSESKYLVLWDPPAVSAQSLDPALTKLVNEVPSDVPSTADLDKVLGPLPSSAGQQLTKKRPTPVGPVEVLEDPLLALPRLDVATDMELFKISAINEALRIFLFLIRRGIRTFLFCNARVLVEILYGAVQKKLGKKEKALSERVVSYRGGYTQDMRRNLERIIFRNEACGVISTNALELGIDLGLLDVVITLGFEGSVSSVRQRLGRAGRSKRPSLGILVAFDSPVERFVVRHLGNNFWKKYVTPKVPYMLLSRDAEPVCFDPTNALLLKQHLACCLKEVNRPLDIDTLKIYFGPKVETALDMAMKTEEVALAAGSTSSYRFCLTSRYLIVSDGDNYKHAMDAKLMLSQSSQAEAENPTLPFLNPVNRARPQGFEVSEVEAYEDFLQQIAIQATPKILTRKQGKAITRPMLFINDVSGMKDARKFVDPHPIVDLRSSGIPNLTLYLFGGAGPVPDQQAGGFVLSGEKLSGLKVIDEANLVAAYITLYPGAVYQIRGRDYLIKLLNLKERYAVATCEKNLDFYTCASDRHSFTLLSLDRMLNATNFPTISPDVEVFLGPLRVNWELPYYYQIRRDGAKKSGGGKYERIELTLPDLAYDTRGIVFDLKPSAVLRFFELSKALLENQDMEEAMRSRASKDESLLLSALHGLGHALTKAATTIIWCDPRELESSCISPMANYSKIPPKLYLFERPSSLALGLADILFRHAGAKLQELLQATLEMLNGCLCSSDSACNAKSSTWSIKNRVTQSQFPFTSAPSSFHTRAPMFQPVFAGPAEIGNGSRAGASKCQDRMGAYLYPESTTASLDARDDWTLQQDGSSLLNEYDWPLMQNLAAENGLSMNNLASILSPPCHSLSNLGTPPTIRQVLDDFDAFSPAPVEEPSTGAHSIDIDQLIEVITSSLTDTPLDSGDRPARVSVDRLLRSLKSLTNSQDLIMPQIPPSPIPTGVDYVFQSLHAQLSSIMSQMASFDCGQLSLGCSPESISSLGLNRWRNIDVTYPILIPFGKLVVHDHADIQHISNYYEFNSNLPSDARRVFGFSGGVNLFRDDQEEGFGQGTVPASMLRTRVAVIHKCPDFLVPRLAQLFNASVAACCPVFVDPIQLVCDRVSRCCVPQNSKTCDANRSYECQERIEALIGAATTHDEEKLERLSELLWRFSNLVNGRLRCTLSEFYSTFTPQALNRKFIPEDLYSTRTGNIGLEFRFAPSKQMKIILAKRTVPKPSALSAVRVDVKGLEICEVRLEQERRVDREWDSMYADSRVPTKRVLRDDKGAKAGKALLVPPKCIRLPQVQMASDM